MDSKTVFVIIVVALINIGTLLVVVVTLLKLGKLLRDNPQRGNDPSDAEDAKRNSWRLWLPEEESAKDEKQVDHKE